MFCSFGRVFSLEVNFMSFRIVVSSICSKFVYKIDFVIN